MSGITKNDIFKIYLQREFGIKLTTEPSRFDIPIPEYEVDLDIKDNKITGKIKIDNIKYQRCDFHHNDNYINMENDILRLFDNYISEEHKQKEAQMKKMERENR